MRKGEAWAAWAAGKGRGEGSGGQGEAGVRTRRHGCLRSDAGEQRVSRPTFGEDTLLVEEAENARLALDQLHARLVVVELDILPLDALHAVLFLLGLERQLDKDLQTIVSTTANQNETFLSVRAGPHERVGPGGAFRCKS